MTVVGIVAVVFAAAVTAVILIVAAVVSSVVLAFIVRRLTADQAPPRGGQVCDLCEQATATVHLTETFDDDEERNLGGGATAMRADYCQACAESLGVG